MPQLVVATFNIHAGSMAGARPSTSWSPAPRLDADVLVLQETWTPEVGDGLACLVAASLGYEVHEVPLAGACCCNPSSLSAHGGGPWNPRSAPLPLGRRRRAASGGTACRLGKARVGTWGIALLSRLPIRRVKTIDLGQLRRDSAQRRLAVLAEIEVEGSRLTVVGTHLAHFTQGSPILLERLRRELPAPRQPSRPRGGHELLGATGFSRAAGLAKGRARPHLPQLACPQPG